MADKFGFCLNNPCGEGACSLTTRAQHSNNYQIPPVMPLSLYRP